MSDFKLDNPGSINKTPLTNQQVVICQSKSVASGMVKVFISSTTVDLGSYREEVKRVLSQREDQEIRPVEQSSFELDYRKVSIILNTAIAECDAVVCLVGFAFGQEPRNSDFVDSRRSYSQLEYYIAKRRHKPTYVFIATDRCPVDNSPGEDADQAELQLKFREWLKSGSDIYYEFSSKAELAEKIAKIKFKSFEPPPVDPTPARLRIQPWLVILALLAGAYFFFSSPSEPVRSSNTVQPTNQVHSALLPLQLTNGSVPFPQVAQRANEDVPPPETNWEQPPQAVPELTAQPTAEQGPVGRLQLQVYVQFNHKFVMVNLKGTAHDAEVSKKIGPFAPGWRWPVNISNLKTGLYSFSAILDDGKTMVTNQVLITENATANVPVFFKAVPLVVEVWPPEAAVIFGDALFEDTKFYRKGSKGEGTFRPGLWTFRFELEDYQPLVTNIFIQTPDPLPAQTIKVALAKRHYPVGIKPLPVPGCPGIMMSETEITRRQFAAFVASHRVDTPALMKCLTAQGWEDKTNSWKEPPFPQSDDDPVVGVSWEEAVAFCQGLTQSERQAGRLNPNQFYRLPSSAEYHMASKDYGWRKNAGNFAGEEVNNTPWPWPLEASTIDHHRDNWPRTAPVGNSGDTHPFNKIHDLAGNVAEWCSDAYRKEMNAPEIRRVDPEYFDEDNEGSAYKAVFGGSWADHDPIDLDLQVRHKARLTDRSDRIGFRVVLDESPSS